VSTGGAATGGTTHQGGATTATGGVGTGGSTAGTGGSSILEPATGALLGLYYGDASISATATKLGRTVPLHLTYYAFSDDWTTDNTADDLRAGRVPFVNWELFGATLDDIAGGTYDTLLNQRATAAKKLGKQFFIDFGAEMNGDWSPWGGADNGKSSAKYVAAYRHVHDIFVAAGATNAIWAFCPNVTSVPDAAWNAHLEYYPGDSYVDWMCVDGYNWGTSESGDGWQSFYQVFKDIYPTLASKNKPIIIGEMASTELGGDKAAWIAQIVPALKNQFPLIKGLVWFDINKETDWRISSSAASEAAFKAMANDPWFVQ
jgi:beta-mannanase